MNMGIMGICLQGYASDHEKSLRITLAFKVPTNFSYICVAHAKRNILECSKLLLSKSLSSEIIQDIFG